MDETTEMLRIEKIKIRSVIGVSDEYLHDIVANAETSMNDASVHGAHLQALKSFVLGMPGDTITAKWPEDWWQAVKERFAPKWYLKRRPVRYCEIDEKRFEKVFLSVFPDKTTVHGRDPIRLVAPENLRA